MQHLMDLQRLALKVFFSTGIDKPLRSGAVETACRVSIDPLRSSIVFFLFFFFLAVKCKIIRRQ